MRAIIEQFGAAFGGMPASKKIYMVVVLGLLVAGFVVMFRWANKVDHQLLYSNLSPDDAGNIASKLREQRIPYKLASGGSAILVPAEKVYELRLALANDRLPAGGHVGFEIFDKTDFSTTEFVQRINYQRALQGELARTISAFREVENARIIVVMPKDSLFVEDTIPPSASVLLKLRSGLSPDKVAGIVHLVASAVEGLAPEQVTVVDTTGKVLFKGPGQADQAALITSNKLDYQRQVETGISGRVQTMLEGIVGTGKAIVRVSSDIDFEQIDFTEEKYDPDSSVIRSQQRRSESSEKGGANVSAARVKNPNQGAAPLQGADTRTRSQKEDEMVNYEINRVARHVIKPSGTIKRLSVAAAVDGTYEVDTAEDGSRTKKYIPRSTKELQDFEKIVKRAMGFDADRGDQVYVSSFPFSISPVLEPGVEGVEAVEVSGTDWLALGRRHLKPVVNFVLVILVFLFVVRPLLKSIKGIGTSVERPRRLPTLEEAEPSAFIPEPSDKAAGTRERVMRERTLRMAKDNVERTEQLVRGWLHEEK
ncbi:MAG: flagellar M-ring protein FliF [Desulfobacterales bacterium]|nr:flagellar M-ring protein FliF [Desulfobacterales bacterium]